jgi:hypothetical protein
MDFHALTPVGAVHILSIVDGKVVIPPAPSEPEPVASAQALEKPRA